MLSSTPQMIDTNTCTPTLLRLAAVVQSPCNTYSKLTVHRLWPAAVAFRAKQSAVSDAGRVHAVEFVPSGLQVKLVVLRIGAVHRTYSACSLKCSNQCERAHSQQDKDGTSNQE
jgi:hypothetical protein